MLGKPAIGETVDVDVRSATGELLRLQTLDSRGYSVSETQIEQAGPTQRVTVRLGRLAGVYFLRATTPTQRIVVKIVKP